MTGTSETIWRGQYITDPAKNAGLANDRLAIILLWTIYQGQ